MTHSALLAKVFILVNRTERVLKYASKTSLSPSSFFYFNRFKAVPLLQFFFVFASVVSYAALFFFCRYLFLISPSFGASGRP